MTYACKQRYCCVWAVWGKRQGRTSSKGCPGELCLGDFLKKRCRGSQVYLYFGNREMIKKIGLKPKWKKPLRNAGLDGRLVRYDMF